MSRRHLFILPVVAFAAMVALLAAGLLTSAVHPSWPAWFGGRAAEQATTEATSVLPTPSLDDMGQATMRIRAPIASMEQQFAAYDKIVVEIQSDGSLCVLGEPMEFHRFRSLLGDQSADQLKTLVSIRPDADCPYQHIGRVISACDQFGIPHQMLAHPTRNAVSPAGDKRA